MFKLCSSTDNIRSGCLCWCRIFCSLSVGMGRKTIDSGPENHKPKIHKFNGNTQINQFKANQICYTANFEPIVYFMMQQFWTFSEFDTLLSDCFSVYFSLKFLNLKINAVLMCCKSNKFAKRRKYSESNWTVCIVKMEMFSDKSYATCLHVKIGTSENRIALR